ncbi:MAG: polymorphic toxin type 24 domain-containing protein [Pirellulaceae bacterium]
MARSSGDLSSNGTPNTVAEKRDSDGQLIQKRYYGSDGRAIKNIDYGHDHAGVGDPHAHDWNWSQVPPRQPARALKAGE